MRPSGPGTVYQVLWEEKINKSQPWFDCNRLFPLPFLPVGVPQKHTKKTHSNNLTLEQTTDSFQGQLCSFFLFPSLPYGAKISKRKTLPWNLHEESYSLHNMEASVLTIPDGGGGGIQDKREVALRPWRTVPPWRSRHERPVPDDSDGQEGTTQWLNCCSLSLSLSQ